MALPLPSPRAAFDLTRSAVGLPTRAFRVLDDIEALVKRVDGIVDRAEEMLDRFARAATSAEETIARAQTVSAAAAHQVEEAAKVSAAAGIVVAESQKIAEGAGTVVARASSTAEKADDLLTMYEPTLRRGAPMANRFVEQLSAEEIEAAIKLVDELPKLTAHLHADILPILATLDRVGPDIHDLLEVTRDLKLAVAGIPGLKMLMRRGEAAEA